MILLFGGLVTLLACAWFGIVLYGLPGTTLIGHFQESQESAHATLNQAADNLELHLADWLKDLPKGPLPPVSKIPIPTRIQAGRVLDLATAGNPGLSAWLLTTRGEPLAWSELGPPVMAGDPGNFENRGPQGFHEGHGLGGKRAIVLWRLVNRPTGQQLVLWVEMEHAVVYAGVREEIARSLAAGGICIILTVVFTLVVTNRMSRQVRAMEKAAREIKEGNLEASAPVYARDEIGLLAGAFNDMVTLLASVQKELRATVDARTLELDHANQELRAEIQERKEIGKRLEQFKRAVEESPVSIMITDPEGRVEYINPRYTEVTGYFMDDVKGMTTTEIRLGMDSEEEHRVLWSTIRSRKEWRGELHSKRKNGEDFWEHVSISPLMDAGGQITHFVAIREDITTFKKSAAEREQLITDLKDALAKVKTLSGFLPICASCKKIRDDHGYWASVEQYIEDHSEAVFSHGICPSCAQKLYPEMFADKERAPRN